MTTKTCSVEGCEKPAKCRGWCGAHYELWRRHGTVITPEKHKQQQRYFDDVACKFVGPDCLIWPFGNDRKGYAQMWHDGRTRRVSRVVCEKVHGKPPSVRHQAAHKCGKGDIGCISPVHLRWATPKENSDDKEAHGTVVRGERQWASKLTDADIRKIRELSKTMKQNAIAKLFSVLPTNVNNILRGKSWKHVQ